MTDSKETVLVLHNPKSGFRHALEIIEALHLKLAESGFVSEVYSDLERLRSRANELSSNQLRAVVAAGGDGTAAAVAELVPSTTPLWVLPLGTENLLARYLGMKVDLDQAIASIQRLKTRTLDAGLANGRLFLIMVGVGFDADVVRRVHSRRQGHIRRWHYWIPILESILSYRFPKLTVTNLDSNSNNQRLEAAWYFLMNLPRYASGLNIAPDASGEDGLIDVCGFRRGGLIRGLTYLTYLRMGNHRSLDDFRHCQSSKFRIDSDPNMNSSVSYQIDGDWGGELPLEVECLPRRLCVIDPIIDLHSVWNR